MGPPGTRGSLSIYYIYEIPPRPWLSHAQAPAAAIPIYIYIYIWDRGRLGRRHYFIPICDKETKNFNCYNVLRYAFKFKVFKYTCSTL